MIREHSNDGLAFIFVLAVCWRFVEMLIAGQWIYAIFAYLFIGFLLWSAVSLYWRSFMNVRIILLWIPDTVIGIFKPTSNQTNMGESK